MTFTMRLQRENLSPAPVYSNRVVPKFALDSATETLTVAPLFCRPAMGRPHWASEEQWAWLMSQAVEYRDFQAKKKAAFGKSLSEQPTKFWPRFLEQWSEKWPEPPLHELVNGGPAIQSASNNTTPADDGVEPNIEDGDKDQNEGTDDGAKAPEGSAPSTDSSTLGAAIKGKRKRGPLTVEWVRFIRLLHCSLFTFCV